MGVQHISLLVIVDMYTALKFNLSGISTIPRKKGHTLQSKSVSIHEIVPTLNGVCILSVCIATYCCALLEIPELYVS